MTHNSSSKLNARAERARVVLPGLVVALAGLSLGLFVARFRYELDPISLAALGDWPGAITATFGVTLFLLAQWRFALRRFLAPDAITAVHIPFWILNIYTFRPEVDLRLAAILLAGVLGLAVALGLRALESTRLNTRRMLRAAPLALGLIVLALYLITLGAHVGQADTFEFQVVALQWGIAHPTGYALYVLIGKLFSLLPMGSIAFRVNLTSALFMTLATLILYDRVLHLTQRRLLSALSAAAFAFSGVVWSQAVVAEVYALNALFVALLLTLLIDAAEKVAGQRVVTSTIYGLFLVLGLGLSHHLTMVLLLPALFIALLIARPRLSLRRWLIALGCFALGLSPWLLIALRWPALHHGAPMAFDQFVEWITGARFGGALILSAWSDPSRWQIVSRFLSEAYGLIGLIVALIGLLALARARWRTALIMLVGFIAYVFYALVYFVPDISVFLIPAFLIMALWIGVGAAFIIDTCARLLPRMRRYVYPLGISLLILIPITLVSRNYARVDQRGRGEALEAWGRAVLALPLAPDAAVLVDSAKIAPLYYLQVTENLRPDLDILVLGTEDEYRRQLDARIATGQTVYLARFLPGLPYRLRSQGPLVAVSNEIERDVPEQTHKLGVHFGDAIELAATAVDETRVTLYWRALNASRPNYHVRLRLIDDDGRVVWEGTGAHPVNGYYPTGAWAQDEVVADYHEIELDAALPPREYTLQVGLFPPFREDGLTTDLGDMWLDVTTLAHVPRAVSSLDRAVRYLYENRVAVSSIAPLGTLPQAARGQVRLNWARIGETAGDMRAQLSLIDADGQLAGSSLIEPYAAGLRIDQWPRGILQTTLEYQAPPRDGVFRVRLGFVDADGLPVAAHCGWLAAPAFECELGALQVDGEAIGDAINFGGQVLLSGWMVDRDVLRPGESIQVTLDWRGLKRWDADYTAFVHLVGPDGRLHGQVDAWPAQGTLPTSSWDAAQRLSDPYSVTLDPDAPSGRYQIEVGWYLLATLRRLPVLDANANAIDDHFIIAEFEVP
jgi:hypothetical protein